MKKFIKLFAPILSVSTVAAIAAPMSSCSCSTCTITLTTDGNGTLSQTTLSVAKGTSFAKAIKKLKIEANDGYSFNGWVDKDGKKFNTRKEITSNFTAKAVFEEGSVITGEPLYWNSTMGKGLYCTNTTASTWDEILMDFEHNKEYAFSFTVIEGHIPYRFGLCYKWDAFNGSIQDDFVVLLNKTDVTGECQMTLHAYISLSNDLMNNIKSGDILTIKICVSGDKTLAPVMYEKGYNSGE